jgi:hypothetical protein
VINRCPQGIFVFVYILTFNIFLIMEKNQSKEVVIDVTTKKKYVKPDFEVYELNWKAPLLSASGQNTGATLGASNYRTW